MTTNIDWKKRDSDGTTPEWGNIDDGDSQNESSLEEKKKNKTSEAAEHTIYEDIPARKKIRLEYMESADFLEEADREVVEPQGVVESALYCECGDVFERRESALDHIREFRT